MATGGEDDNDDDVDVGKEVSGEEKSETMFRKSFC